MLSTQALLLLAATMVRPAAAGLNDSAVGGARRPAERRALVQRLRAGGLVPRAPLHRARAMGAPPWSNYRQVGWTPDRQAEGCERETRCLSRAGGTELGRLFPRRRVASGSGTRSRATPGLPRAVLRLGQSAAGAASTLDDPTARVSHTGADEPAGAVERRCGAPRAAGRGRDAHGQGEKARRGPGRCPGVIGVPHVTLALSIPVTLRSGATKARPLIFRTVLIA